MSERRQPLHTTLSKARRSLVNYSLPSITSVPGKMMEKILSAITAKHLKDKKGTASRDLQRAHHT